MTVILPEADPRTRTREIRKRGIGTRWAPNKGLLEVGVDAGPVDRRLGVIVDTNDRLADCGASRILKTAGWVRN